MKKTKWWARLLSWTFGISPFAIAGIILGRHGLFDIMAVVLGIPYLIGALVCWRALSGKVAWEIHTTAKFQRDVDPALEDWVLAAFLTAFVAFPFWWAVALFKFTPQIVKTETEKEAEGMANQIRYEKKMLETSRREKQLGIGQE